jgi:endo-beta-N-acetylglucosaminidase D
MRSAARVGVAVCMCVVASALSLVAPLGACFSCASPVCCKQRLGDHALVLYYDSLDARTGKIAYQNGLSPANKPFFDACDGLFTNYWWSTPVLQASTALAGARRRDVYAGVDCFARPPNPSFVMPYQAGGCATGVRMVADAGLSLALFAPGWSLECGAAKDQVGDAARQCDAAFWEQLAARRLFKGGK